MKVVIIDQDAAGNDMFVHTVDVPRELDDNMVRLEDWIERFLFEEPVNA